MAAGNQSSNSPSGTLFPWWHFLALLSSFGESDRDRLFAASYLASSAAFATLERATFAFAHRAFDIPGSAARIFSGHETSSSVQAARVIVRDRLEFAKPSARHLGKQVTFMRGELIRRDADTLPREPRSHEATCASSRLARPLGDKSLRAKWFRRAYESQHCGRRDLR